jgi:FdhD protein
MNRPGGRTKSRVLTYDGLSARQKSDEVATEEPLEIRLLAGGEVRTLAVTMRTPGADFELATGFLFSEGVISSKDEIKGLSYCVDRDVGEEQRFNIVNVALRSRVMPDIAALERHFLTSSACGVCGRAVLDQLMHRVGGGEVRLAPEVIYGLPNRMREAQKNFASTGGLHAAGLFTLDGELQALREDVGRHNALDKLVGWAFLEGSLPLKDSVLLVSGRASYELAQKAAAAGVPVLCAISAPSSLAIGVAEEVGMTLIGFLRDERMNVYSGAERVRSEERSSS